MAMFIASSPPTTSFDNDCIIVALLVLSHKERLARPSTPAGQRAAPGVISCLNLGRSGCWARSQLA